MDTVSGIVLSLALGAAATTGEEMVKDAYHKVKSLIVGDRARASLGQLEIAPESREYQGALGEILRETNAEANTELLTAVKSLLEAIRQRSPKTISKMGIDIREIEAVNLKLSDIVSSEHGVRISQSRFSGDVEIHGVRAGEAS